MRILQKDTQCIVVDYQQRLLPPIYENEALLENSRILIEGLKLLAIPIIVTEQYPKGLGHTAPEILELVSDFPVMGKTAFSCFDDELIKKAIADNLRKNVILIGIEAHICVLQTLVDLTDVGYNVILVEDCISARNPRDKSTALLRATSEGAVITSYEALLFELTRNSKAECFKGISNLIK